MNDNGNAMPRILLNVNAMRILPGDALKDGSVATAVKIDSRTGVTHVTWETGVTTVYPFAYRVEILRRTFR